MVPHHWPKLAGAGIQTIAQLGTAVVSKSRTDIYVKEANEKIFMPRGLNVCIASSKSMRTILRIPETQSVIAPRTPETMEMSMLERELLAVRPYNAILYLFLPEPAEQTTLLAKLSARQVLAQAKKNKKTAVKERKTAVEKDERRDDEMKRSELERNERRRRKVEKGIGRMKGIVKQMAMEVREAGPWVAQMRRKRERRARRRKMPKRCRGSSLRICRVAM